MKTTSLRDQLTRAAMLTMLLVTVLSAGALLVYELLNFRQVWSNDLRTQSELISLATASANVFNDPKVARENLSLLRARPAVTAAAVYGKDEALIAAFVRGPQERVPASPKPATTAERGTAYFSGSDVEISFPIEQDGERVGTLYMRAQHSIWPQLLNHAVILLTVGAAGLVLAYGVFNRLQRHVTAPLLKITEVAQEVITSRNWALRAPETPYRDVRILVDAFNGMLNEVEVRTSELERAQRDLMVADRRKDEFLATLAHELRNPLAPMTNSVALLEMPTLAIPARNKAVVVLGRQLRHMVRLIDDLLDASRIATGKLSLVKQRVDIGALVTAVTELAEPSAIQAGLSLAASVPSRALFVDGDPVRLSQVFSNLLSNACRYTSRGGTVNVSVQWDDESIDVSVQDSGIGVALEMQTRIFDLFEQVNKSMERGTAGLGIGLTLARQLVELHGGSVSMSSGGVGTGSRFTVRLPLFKTGGALASDLRATGLTSVKLKVLVADDNVDLAESLAALLETQGHDVEIAHDGEAAVRAAVERVPDVALLDIGMPGLNGYEVARQLRSQIATKAIHMVAITGWGQPADRVEAAAAGFDMHLVKPVEPEELFEILRGVHKDVHEPL